MEKRNGYLDSNSQEMIRRELAKVSRGAFAARRRLLCLVDHPGPFDWASVCAWEPQLGIHNKVGNLPAEFSSTFWGHHIHLSAGRATVPCLDHSAGRRRTRQTATPRVRVLIRSCSPCTPSTSGARSAAGFLFGFLSNNDRARQAQQHNAFLQHRRQCVHTTTVR